MRLLLIRHGHTPAIVLKNPDPPLTTLGEHQAMRLGAWLAEHYHTNRLFTSPLCRARQTASLIGVRLELQPQVEPGLSEADFEIAEQLPQGTVFSPQMQRFEHRLSGPLYLAYQRQVAQAVEHIMADSELGETILVVAHAAALGTALRCLLESSVISVRTDHTAQHELVWRDGRWLVVAMNRREHLLESV